MIASGRGSVDAAIFPPISQAPTDRPLNPLIVEICGSPGAGKTALLPVLEEVLRERGFVPEPSDAAVASKIAGSGLARILSRLHIAPGLRRGRGRRYVVDGLWGAFATLAHPALVWRAAVAIGRDPVTLAHRLVLFHRFIAPVARQHFLNGRLQAGDAVIFDEGPVHRVVNLFGWRHRQAPASEVRAYARRLSAPDLLVLVRANSDTATERLAARGLPRYLQARRPGEVARFVRHANEALGIAVAEIEPRTMLITIDNDGTIAEARASLAHQFDREFRPGRRMHRRHPSLEFKPTLPINLPRPDRLIAAWTSHRSSSPDLWRVLDAYPLRSMGGQRMVGRGRSRNAVIETEVGAVLVKRYKASVPDEAIDCEHSVLTELARLDVAAPRLVRTQSGDTLVRLGAARHATFHHRPGYMAGHDRLAWPGEPNRLARLAGERLSRLHDALDGFWPSALNPIGLGPDHQRLLPTAWHLDQLQDAGAARGPAEREVAMAAPWIEERLLGVENELMQSSLSVTVIHGDYGPYNLLLRPGAPVIPIDFELARPDWRLVDLATAIPRFAGNRLRFDKARAHAFLAGYLDGGGARESELRLIPRVAEYLALRRLAVCWSRHVRSRDPGQIDEALSQLAFARSLAAGAHPLTRMVG